MSYSATASLVASFEHRLATSSLQARQRAPETGALGCNNTTLLPRPPAPLPRHAGDNPDCLRVAAHISREIRVSATGKGHLHALIRCPPVNYASTPNRTGEVRPREGKGTEFALLFPGRPYAAVISTLLITESPLQAAISCARRKHESMGWCRLHILAWLASAWCLCLASRRESYIPSDIVKRHRLSAFTLSGSACAAQRKPVGYQVYQCRVAPDAVLDWQLAVAIFILVPRKSCHCECPIEETWRIAFQHACRLTGQGDFFPLSLLSAGPLSFSCCYYSFSAASMLCVSVGVPEGVLDRSCYLLGNVSDIEAARM